MIKVFKPTVLVVSPNPQVQGGVTTFIECMKRHITGCTVTPFYIGGAGQGNEGKFSTFKRLVTAPLQLVRLVKKHKFSAVHINPSFDKKSLIRDSLLVLALRAIGYHRILFYIHGWDPSVHQAIMTHKYLRGFLAWVLNGIGLITVLDENFRKGLINLGVHPSRIIVTRTMYEKTAMDAAQGQPPIHQRRFILFMSRFDPQKGGRELLQAFAALAADITDLDLVMAGDGSDNDFLRGQVGNMGIGERVIFTGYVAGAEKARYLCDCTLFALPTYYRSEGMPIAVLEAMGAGKPLLVGAAGALPSILSDPANGVLLDKVSAQNVKTGLLRLLNDAAFAASAGKNNRELAEEKFEAAKVTAEIESYYRRVLEC